MSNRISFVLLWLFAGLFPACLTPVCEAADVLIVADIHLKPVTEIFSGIRKTLNASLKIYSPADARGILKGLVDKEDAKVVIALGREALAEALQLPPDIPVIFDLVVTPPVISRPNTTGFYMATPVREYAELIKANFHSIKKMSVVGSRDQLNILSRGDSLQQTSYDVRNSVGFVSTLKHLDDTDAILLLPNVALLTATAMDEAYLLSFRKGIPLLGVSERNVKEGALLALVVDTVNVGKVIGDYATKAIREGNIGQVPPSPPRKFDMYLNTATARKMGIEISAEMVRMAKRVYP